MADHDTIQHLTYDDLGRVVANNRNGTKSDMTYGYDRLHGWITDIRSGGGFEQHLFREAGSFEPKWNGSITAMMWKTPDSDVTRRYDYCYDGLNRLTDAMYCEVTGQSGSSGSGDPNNPQNIIPETLQTEAFDKYSEYALYDKNSNFTYFQRYGMLNNRTYGQTDDLAFSYNGNQFKWVDDDTEQTLTYNGAFDFDDGADSNVEYTYNANGQLTSDANSGISFIQYDMLGNPKKVTMASGDYIEYVYAPDGTKLKASHYTKWTNNTYSCQNTFYRGNMIYEYGANGYPDKILFPGGYYFYVSADDMMMRDYYVQDYQGNNRMVVHQYMGSDFFGQTTHYYPFGGVIGDISTNQDLLDYKYSGKEFDRTYGLDFYDFHARQYDPKVPRFTSIDPKAEEYYGISPYAYCAGDPVNCVDPDGERPKASDAALMAAYAYKDNRQAMDQYVLQLAKSGWIVSDYETSIQKDYTRFYQNGLQSTLFQRTKDGITEYAYVYAGTNSFEDAVEDVVQLAGAAPQYHTAIYNARTLSNELGNKELTFVGHSLGGGEAIASSMATGRAAITFNPATVSVLTKQFEGLNKVPNVVNYRAIGTKIGIGNIRLGGDMLNNLQEKIGLSLPGITIGIPTGIIPTHTINDFLTHKLPEL